MKRDMDLIRLLLLQVEGEAEVDISEYTEEQINHHKYLLLTAGLAKGIDMTGMTDRLSVADVWELTWDGHDFLDGARDESRWRKAVQATGSATIEAIKTVLTSLAISAAKGELNLN